MATTSYTFSFPEAAMASTCHCAHLLLELLHKSNAFSEKKKKEYPAYLKLMNNLLCYIRQKQVEKVWLYLPYYIQYMTHQQGNTMPFPYLVKCAGHKGHELGYHYTGIKVDPHCLQTTCYRWPCNIANYWKTCSHAAPRNVDFVADSRAAGEPCFANVSNILMQCRPLKL